MSWRNRWVVLAPGSVAWVERRTREVLDEIEDRGDTRYTIVPGQGHYQVLVQEDHQSSGSEMLLARVLSRDCEEPVYSIEGREESPCVSRFLKGERGREEREPEDLVRALGCVVPWAHEPPRTPLQRVTRKVVLIQGLSEDRVREALAKKAGHPVPASYYRLEQVPQGLLLREETGELMFEDIALAQRFPRATVYAVTAKPDLDFFRVCVRRNRRTEEFVLPPKEFPQNPVLQEVLGERTPERILAALGMSREWFRL